MSVPTANRAVTGNIEFEVAAPTPMLAVDVVESDLREGVRLGGESTAEESCDEEVIDEDERRGDVPK